MEPFFDRTSTLDSADSPSILAILKDLIATILTPRQREVLYCLAEGKPTKLICEELRMSEGTVKVHIGAIFRAMRVHNRTQATLVALRDGWIHPEMWSRS